jgi:hypothetical protein
MLGIRAEIRRYVDDSFPGWIECAFSDASGTEHTVLEKVPILTTENIVPTSAFPRPCVIACTLVEESVGDQDRKVLLVDTGAPWGVESTAGLTKFHVLREQVVEIEDRRPTSR